MEIIGGVLLLLSLASNVWMYRSKREVQQRRMIAEDNLHKIRYNDTNTGLPNRRWMERMIDKKLLEASVEEIKELYVVVFQLATISEIDSTIGRDLKHKLLQSIWENLMQDCKETIGACTRSGAGQVVALMRTADRRMLVQCVRRVVRDEEYMELDGRPIRVSMQVGIRQLGEKDISGNEVLADAGLATQEAQRVRIYDEDMKANRAFQARVESALREGFRQQEFQVWYQPKYDIATKRCVGAETLVRWESSSLGFLLPGKFIRTCEQTGFILQLDYYMLGNAFRFQRKRLDAGKRCVPISVNQSRLHMQEVKYIEHMSRLSAYYGGASCIELELTETAMDFSGLQERKRAIEVVHALKDIGFSLSMDDFGTGYSDISLLNDMPLDVLKLDRSMLTASEDSERMQLVLKKIVELGEGLGMQVLCEGIETEAQEELLLRCGCRYGQGYFYGRPMPSVAFEQFLDTRI